MHLSRAPTIAACLAGLAMSAVAFATPTPAAHAHGAECQAQGKAEPKSLAFVVSHVEHRPAGEIVLTFENGEVWQQTDRNKKLDIERGEQVVIRRSTSGAFTLVSRAGLSTRVKRVH
jgi:hypothetical protein